MKTILIIEDNELNLKLMVDLLAINGYQTITARSAEEGMSILTTQTPDLILMDIRMPNISGIEAIARIKTNKNLDDVPVIAVTASVMNHDKQQIFAAGFHDFLQKPIDIAMFLETVRKHLKA
jgi:two-component system cell cycle response regulator DivK